MNSDKLTAKARQAGNAMIYVLLAIALLAALSMTLTRQSGTGGNDLSQEEADMLALQVIAYAASAQQVVEQMVMSGTPVANLNFLPPNHGNFAVGPDIHKIYHPAGGGLNYKQTDSRIFIERPTPNGGWYMVRFNNVEWTPTTQHDVILTAFNINKLVCEAINKKITGNAKSVPGFMGLASALVGSENGAGGNNDLTADICPNCEGHSSLCIDNTAGAYSFYSILLPQ